jgi:hypothetical protein
MGNLYAATPGQSPGYIYIYFGPFGPDVFGMKE